MAVSRFSDEQNIIDPETGEEIGSIKETEDGWKACSKVDREQFPGTTIDEVCPKLSSPN